MCTAVPSHSPARGPDARRHPRTARQARVAGGAGAPTWAPCTRLFGKLKRPGAEVAQDLRLVALGIPVAGDQPLQGWQKAGQVCTPCVGAPCHALLNQALLADCVGCLPVPELAGHPTRGSPLPPASALCHLDILLYPGLPESNRRVHCCSWQGKGWENGGLTTGSTPSLGSTLRVHFLPFCGLSIWRVNRLLGPLTWPMTPRDQAILRVIDGLQGPQATTRGKQRPACGTGQKGSKGGWQSECCAPSSGSERSQAPRQCRPGCSLKDAPESPLFASGSVSEDRPVQHIVAQARGACQRPSLTARRKTGCLAH